MLLILFFSLIALLQISVVQGLLFIFLFFLLPTILKFIKNTAYKFDNEHCLHFTSFFFSFFLYISSCIICLVAPLYLPLAIILIYSIQQTILSRFFCVTCVCVCVIFWCQRNPCVQCKITHKIINCLINYFIKFHFRECSNGWRLAFAYTQHNFR